MTQTLNRQRRFQKRLLSKIGSRAQAACSSIGAPLLRNEVSRYLRAHAVQSVTLLNYWKREDPDTAQLRWEEWQRPSVPYRLDRLSPTPIPWYPKKKSTSGYRKVCKLPQQLKMWHSLAKDLICAAHNPAAHIADWPGRGRDKQVRDVAAAITSQSQWVVVADVRRAFATFNPEAVYELPSLPNELVRRAIDSRNQTFVGSMRSIRARPSLPSSVHDDLEMDPTGLLEGSPTSNAIFSVFLDDLPDHLPDSVIPFVNCDNVILVCPNETLAHLAAASSVRYFTDHRAGPFELKYVCQPVWHTFDHLGYSLRCTLHGKVAVGLSAKNLLRLLRRINYRKDEETEPMRWLHSSFAALGAHEMVQYERMISDGT